MPVKFVKPQAAKVWHKIEFNGGDFEIECRPPTYEELMTDAALSYGPKLDSRMSVITGWRGVEDANGSPVPYSEKALNTLLEAYPDAVFWVCESVSRMFVRLTGDEEKNSVSLSADGSAGSPTTPTVSPTPTLNAGSGGEGTENPPVSG